MKQWFFGMGLCALLGSAAAQQVWKCEENGVVRYTDQPCEGQGHPVMAASAPSAASAASTPKAAASGVVWSLAAAPINQSARRHTSDKRQPRDPLAPMPPGFVQRGNPRAQMLAAQNRAAQALAQQDPPAQNVAVVSPP